MNAALVKIVRERTGAGVIEADAASANGASITVRGFVRFKAGEGTQQD